MSNTAITICAAAYRQANMDQTLTTFDPTLEFPYNIALDLINTVIQEMNRMGHYWFTETQTALTYSPGVNSYTLSALTPIGVDQRAIIRVRREATNYWGELVERNYRRFQQRFRMATVPTQMPSSFAKFGGILYLDTIPDQDYSLMLYHYADIQLIAATTDTLPMSTSDEDVIRDGVYAYLCERIGRGDTAIAYQAYISKVNALLQDQKQDAGLPLQMPAAF